jgi:NTP pyrophosphatase (non-canonical NTP hydrolase)
MKIGHFNGGARQTDTPPRKGTIMNEPKFSNGLSDAETKRLAKLSEECGEIVQIVGKILCHGYDSYSPKDEHQVTNRALLCSELGDLAWVVELMVDKEDLDGDSIDSATESKGLRAPKYLHHQS